jgi:hypothetical protein
MLLLAKRNIGGWLYFPAKTKWIYAVGLPNNQWTGKHNIHGSFQIGLQSCLLVVPDTPSPTNATNAPTTSPSFAPTRAPTTVPSVALTWAPVIHAPTASPGPTTSAAPSAAPTVSLVPTTGYVEGSS